ncbi:uncharacterized protein AC631_02131 [Debaryomyces fabryi]|uniref:Peptidase S59 domain-containing protein n=1 Tax=Debaryomyces fabryi TaxID=58627 RepID=A0A0V1Q0W5_9ASCO|nr:uncharacterized protein AC631_02131 [Debaryomyces fabryi]KSA02135.1 hypothetical protein AC631_02131 [Debaryomyces fabryi]CUM55356.1 unnamed protein product [Debaryomyces fabryi]
MFGSTLQGGSSGSGNSNNNWGSSTGFSKATSFSGASSGPSGGSLFGNSSTKDTNSAGLFGNASSSASNSGGLFGKPPSNNTNTGGLFGNLNNTNPTSGGLFNSNKPEASGGLFGGSSSNAAPSNNLFGSSNTANSGTNLFGNTASSKMSSSNPNANTNLFGASTTNNLFSNNSLSSQASIPSNINSTNPYSYDKVFSNLQKADSVMPKSVTEDLFVNTSNKDSSERKKILTPVDKAKQAPRRSSLLSRLGQTLKYFRYSNASTQPNNFASVKGLFTQANFLTSKDKQNILPKPTKLVPKRITKPSYHTSIENRGIKRLVIKSKPLKFHLIDADKVLNTKKRRIVSEVVPSDKLLTDNYLSDEDDSDNESFNIRQKDTASRFPYKVSAGDEKANGKNADQILGGDNDHEDNDADLDDKDANNGYWCTPSLSELSQLSAQRLANVENFIIGRIGHGQIAYNYPVDLSGVAMICEENNTPLNEELFGKIVEIGDRIVKVYQDAENKPPIGFGLNIPATISLESIQPRKGESRSDFIKYLQRQVGMEFVTYDPITCIWTFKVKHFSIWGLVDEEGEFTSEQNQLAELKRKQDSKEEEAVLEYSRIYEDEKFSQELKKQRVSAYTSGLPGGWDYSQIMQNTPLKTKRNLVADEINNQLEVYQQEQTTNALASNVSDITIDSEEESRSASPDSIDFGIPDGSNAPFEKKNFDYLKQFISVLPKDVDMSQIINEKAYEPEITNDAMFDNIQLKPNLAVSDDWLVQLELCNDINSSLTPYITESSKVDGENKNRITAAKVDNILFPEFNKDSLSMDHASTPINSKKFSNLEGSPSEMYDEAYPRNVSKVIYHMLSKSTISTRSNKFPIVEKNSNLSFADLLLNEKSTGEEEQILKLGSALFDEHKLNEYSEYKDVDPSDSHLVKYLENLQQKKNFSEWLKVYNRSTVERWSDEKKSDILEYIFIKICAGDIKDAISLAMDSNNAHLSVILTLIDSNDDAVKSTASNQLQYWSDTSSLSFIPKPIVKIYRILSGDFKEVLSDLPWNISLAVKLFYGDNTSKLHELIQEFQVGIVDNGPVYDILTLYNQIHAKDKNQALQSIKSSHLNIKLKWFFNKILSKGDVSNDVLNTDLSLSFGNFLERIGLWKESLFVYSHISDDKESEKVIRNLVVTNIDHIKSSNDEENYITKVLKVPHNLVYEAVSIQEHSLGNYWEECEALITAKLWEKAHDCITKELGPSTIISNDSESKNHLKTIIAKFPESGHIIPLWSQGAGIYSNFISLSEEEIQERASLHTQSLLVSLLSNLPLLEDYNSSRCRIAMKLMSKKVGDIALNYADQIGNIKGLILSLPLGEVERNYFNIRLQLVNI